MSSTPEGSAEPLIRVMAARVTVPASGFFYLEEVEKIGLRMRYSAMSKGVEHTIGERVRVSSHHW